MSDNNYDLVSAPAESVQVLGWQVTRMVGNSTGDSSTESRTPLDLWRSAFEGAFQEYIERPYVLGPHASMSQARDPKHNLFTLARYKFCSKMLAEKKHLVEVGCGDGFGFDLVHREVKPDSLTCVDFDQLVIEDNRRRLAGYAGVEFLALDIAQQSLPGQYDGGWSADVIEHIYPADEMAFLDNILASLTKDAVFVMGTPNAAAAAYASEASQASHVNLKDAQSLRALMARRFQNVFMFSMNDEVVHTGYAPMAHYLFAVGAGVR